MGQPNNPSGVFDSGIGEVAVPQRPFSALAMSLIFHVILLTAIGWFWSTAPRGTAPVNDRPVGIAVVHRLPDRDRYVDTAEVIAEETNVEASQATDASSAAAAPPADVAPPIDLSGVLKAMKSTPSPSSASGLAGETSLSGDAFGDGSGPRPDSGPGETTAVMFGVSGSGSRFLYVMDRSDSMNGFDGAPLRAAKTELLRSLQSLSERQQFQIIFYNDRPKPFQIPGVPLEMITGESSHVQRAAQYVESVRAFGGTEHEAALKLALRMGPEVIFFLTDARIPRLSQPQLDEIRRRAQRIGTTIHAIEFGPEPAAPGSSFLRELAAQNNGQYQYIDVRTLAPASQAKP